MNIPTTSFALAAIILAIGLGVTAVEILNVISSQEAEAKGCSPFLTGYNASQGRCFKP